MESERPMIYFKNVVYWLSGIMTWMAGVALVAMTLFICLHVVLRGLFSRPIGGTFEITGYMATIVFPFAMALATAKRTHIIIDVFVRGLRPHTQAIINSITGLISTAIFALMAGYNALYATKLWQRGEISTGLQIPYFGFVYGVAFCCAVMCLVLLIEFAESLTRMMKK